MTGYVLAYFVLICCGALFVLFSRNSQLTFNRRVVKQPTLDVSEIEVSVDICINCKYCDRTDHCNLDKFLINNRCDCFTPVKPVRDNVSNLFEKRTTELKSEITDWAAEQKAINKARSDKQLAQRSKDNKSTQRIYRLDK